MRFRLHTFQRIAGFTCSVCLLLFAGVAIANGMKIAGKGGIPVPVFASVFIVIVSVAVGGMGIWLTAFTRSRTLDELDQDEHTTTSELPSPVEGSVTCRFSLGSKAGAVFVDTESNRIHFSNCHMKFGFTNSADESFQCPIADVRRIHDKHIHRVGMCLSIVTRHGRCMIRSIDVDYSEVRDLLVSLVPVNDPGYILHDPAMQLPLGLAITGSGVLGLLTGWWLLPARASDTFLVVYLIAGTTIGIAGALLVTGLVDRKLRAGSENEI